MNFFSTYTIQTSVRIQEVVVAVERLQHQTNDSSSPFLGRARTIERLLGDFSSETVADDRRLQMESAINQTTRPSNLDQPSPHINNAQLSAASLTKSGERAGSANAPGPTFRIEKSTCDMQCPCSCHQRLQKRNPYLVNAVLGSLFSGYQVSPWSIQRCDNVYCGNRSMRYTYEYTFPRWFTRHTVLIILAQSVNRGPEMCLRVMKSVPAKARIFAAAESGKMALVRQLLSQGKASVDDVDEHGHTPLHVSQCLDI